MTILGLFFMPNAIAQTYNYSGFGALELDDYIIDKVYATSYHHFIEIGHTADVANNLSVSNKRYIKKLSVSGTNNWKKVYNITVLNTETIGWAENTFADVFEEPNNQLKLFTIQYTNVFKKVLLIQNVDYVTENLGTAQQYALSGDFVPTKVLKIGSDYCIIGRNDSKNIVMLKIDSIGAMQGEYEYEYSNTYPKYPADAMLLSDNSIIISGSSIENGNFYGFLMRLKVDGTVMWSKQMVAPYFSNYQPYSQGFRTLSATTNCEEFQVVMFPSYIYNFNKKGDYIPNTLRKIEYTLNGVTHLPIIRDMIFNVTNDNTEIIAATINNTAPNWLALSPNYTIDWQKRHNSLALNEAHNGKMGIVHTNDGGFLTHFNNKRQSNAFGGRIFKTDSLGFYGDTLGDCYVENADFSLSLLTPPPPYTPTNINFLAPAGFSSTIYNTSVNINTLPQTYVTCLFSETCPNSVASFYITPVICEGNAPTVNSFNPVGNGEYWFDVAGTPWNSCSPDCGILQLRLSERLTDLDSLIAEGGITDSLYQAEMQYSGSRFLFEKLSQDSTLLDSSLTMQTFFNSMTGTSIDKFHELKTEYLAQSAYDSIKVQLAVNDSLIDNALKTISENDSLLQIETDSLLIANLQNQNKVLYNTIQTLSSENQSSSAPAQAASIAQANELRDKNGNIVDINLYAIDERVLNDIYFSTFAKGIYTFTTLQQEQITDIAYQCPYTGGDAVYRARALQFVIDGTLQYDDAGACAAQNIAYRKPSVIEQEPTVSAWLIPNPTDGLVSLHISEKVQESTTIHIFDGLGKVVKTLAIPVETDIFSFDTKDLSAGIYYYSLTIHGKSLKGKLVIAK